MDELKRIVGLLLAMALVAAGFVVVLGIGFALNGPPQPALTAAIAPAGLVVIVAAGGLIMLVRSYRGRHVPLIAAGRKEFPPRPPTAEQAAYARDPTALTTCEDLRPTERAMRAAGVKVTLRRAGVIDAACVIDAAAFAARLGENTPVSFRIYPGDRPGEPESALIVCATHSSWIAVVHPADATAGTPRFP